MKITCPHCQQECEVEDSFSGGPAECPHCHGIIQVPAKTNSNVSKYKPPVLASIFYYIAILCIPACIFSVFLSDIYFFVSSLFGIFINWGISQVIEYIAKTAYYTEKISNQLEKP